MVIYMDMGYMGRHPHREVIGRRPRRKDSASGGISIQNGRSSPLRAFLSALSSADRVHLVSALSPHPSSLTALCSVIHRLPCRQNTHSRSRRHVGAAYTTHTDTLPQCGTHTPEGGSPLSMPQLPSPHPPSRKMPLRSSRLSHAAAHAHVDAHARVDAHAPVDAHARVTRGHLLVRRPLTLGAD